MTKQFSEKIREAWGYNDALLHAETSYVPAWHSGPRDTHFDKAYVRGYYAGMDAYKACPCPPKWCFASEASPQADCPRAAKGETA